MCIRYGNAGCKLYGSISSNAQKDVWTDRRLFAGNGGADLPWYNVLYFELPLPNGSTGQLLDVMDYISNSFLMPFISLLTSILIGWVIGPDWIVGEVEKNGERFKRAKLYRFMIKYVVPVVMLILFLTSTGLLNRIA